MEKNIQYPLKEKIGNPYLLVGRKKEFSNFRKWIENIPGMLSKSRVILALCRERGVAVGEKVACF